MVSLYILPLLSGRSSLKISSKRDFFIFLISCSDFSFGLVGVLASGFLGLSGCL